MADVPSSCGGGCCCCRDSGCGRGDGLLLRAQPPVRCQQQRKHQHGRQHGRSCAAHSQRGRRVGEAGRGGGGADWDTLAGGKSVDAPAGSGQAGGRSGVSASTLASYLAAGGSGMGGLTAPGGGGCTELEARWSAAERATTEAWPPSGHIITHLAMEQSESWVELRNEAFLSAATMAATCSTASSTSWSTSATACKAGVSQGTGHSIGLVSMGSLAFVQHCCTACASASVRRVSATAAARAADQAGRQAGHSRGCIATKQQHHQQQKKRGTPAAWPSARWWVSTQPGSQQRPTGSSQAPGAAGGCWHRSSSQMPPAAPSGR